MHDLISVVIPTFQRPIQVRAAVASVLAQTWPAVEVLVISDGPHAETKATVAEFDGRVRYLELPSHQGPAAARNAGVAASRGEWLGFLDDDDLMLPRKLEEQMKLTDRLRPERMISCRYIYRHDGREDIWPLRPLLEGEEMGDYLLLRRSFFGRPGVVSLQSLLMHRSLPERLPFSSHEEHEDWAWLLEVWHALGATLTFVWEPLVVYQISTAEVSRSRRLNWGASVAWAEQFRPYLSDGAFCSFLATKAALKARRAGDWQGLWTIAKLVFRNRPGLLDILFLAGVAILPTPVLHEAWKRSLRVRGKERRQPEESRSPVLH